MQAESAAIPRRLPGEPGIWIMVFGDMAVFSIFFIAFIYSRRADLPTFTQSQTHLNTTFGLINTLFMLSSSWFVASGVQAAWRNDARRVARYFSFAFLCGLGFAIVKIAEYTQKVRAGFVINSNDFFMYYYMLTGIHFMHVLIGMTMLAFFVRYARRGTFDAVKVRNFESGASFWHVVDLLWIVLFALLYLIK